MTPAQPQLRQAAAWLRSGFMLRNSFALEVPSPLSGGIEGGLAASLILPLQLISSFADFFTWKFFFSLPAPSEEPVSF
jgi:hypothetical protein